MYPKLRYVSGVSLVDIIYGVYVDLVKFLILWVHFIMTVPSSTILSYFNQWVTWLLYLRNGLLSTMMQQSCNNALSLIGEELAHLKCNLRKIS